MNKEDAVRYFTEYMTTNQDISAAVAAINTLIEYLKLSQAETLAGLRDGLKECIRWLMETDSSVTAISSGCELFLRFITLAALDHKNFDECKKILVNRGNIYLETVAGSREKIAKLGHPFITDGANVLTHSYSRVVMKVLIEASKAKKRFNVYVTESCPDRSGLKMAKELEDNGIPHVVILDSAAGYLMERIDLVIMGAEGIVESGGIINKIGTYQIATCAKFANKPVYVVAESFKFVRMIYPLNQQDVPDEYKFQVCDEYKVSNTRNHSVCVVAESFKFVRMIYPLNQQDVPDEYKYPASKMKNNADLNHEHPLIDYTPPAFITLLFTDLGVLTPSGISDELIKLYL